MPTSLIVTHPSYPPATLHEPKDLSSARLFARMLFVLPVESAFHLQVSQSGEKDATKIVLTEENWSSVMRSKSGETTKSIFNVRIVLESEDVETANGRAMVDTDHPEGARSAKSDVHDVLLPPEPNRNFSFTSTLSDFTSFSGVRPGRTPEVESPFAARCEEFGLHESEMNELGSAITDDGVRGSWDIQGFKSAIGETISALPFPLFSSATDFCFATTLAFDDESRQGQLGSSNDREHLMVSKAHHKRPWECPGRLQDSETTRSTKAFVRRKPTPQTPTYHYSLRPRTKALV